MSFYIDEKTKVKRYDDKNLVVEIIVERENRETKELVGRWEVYGYYPNLEMVFKSYVLKKVHDAEITQDFGHVVKQLKYVLRQYEKLAKRIDEVERQNKKIIEQNEKIINLKQKQLDKELIVQYNDIKVEDEIEGWNY